MRNMYVLSDMNLPLVLIGELRCLRIYRRPRYKFEMKFWFTAANRSAGKHSETWSHSKILVLSSLAVSAPSGVFATFVSSIGSPTIS